MKNWYLQYPELLENEIQDLEANGIIVDKDSLNPDRYEIEGVNLNCTIPVDNTLGINVDEPLVLEIHFPSNYPFFRPEINVKSNLILERHQNPISKGLCLIPRPTQYWNPEDRILKFIKDRIPLVLDKGRNTDLKSISEDITEQGEPISEYYLSRVNANVFSSSPIFEDTTIPISTNFEIYQHGFVEITIDKIIESSRLLEDITINGTSTLLPTLDDSNKFLSIFIDRWLDHNNTAICQTPTENFTNSTKRIHSKWYKITSSKTFFDSKDRLKFLLTELEKNKIPEPKAIYINVNNLTITRIIPLLFPEEQNAGRLSWGWAMLISGIAKRTKAPWQALIPIMSISHEELTIRNPNAKPLKDKIISVVGLGCLGAPSAIEFAKNGVKELRLMDYDIVELPTTVRWPLGVKSVGILKTAALKKFIEENYPLVKVVIFNHKIGSEGIQYLDENLKINKFLNGTDLLYDATAEIGINNFLSRICKEEKIKYIQIEGRQGAWGGHVMRVIPEKTRRYNLYWCKL